MKRGLKLLRGWWFGKAEPYPHLTDAELDSVISDWLDGAHPAPGDTTAEALASVVASIADGMSMDHPRRAA